MKSFTILLFALIYLSASAQNSLDSNTASDVKNELRLNILSLAGGMPEVSYERIFANNTSVGISGIAFIDNENAEFTIFGLSPNYRFYFGQKKASGFFIEGNLIAFREKVYDYSYTYDSGYGGYGGLGTRVDLGFKNNFGYGAIIGDKIITKSGFTGEFSFGIERLHRSNAIEYFPRIGIHLGKRF